MTIQTMSLMIVLYCKSDWKSSFSQESLLCEENSQRSTQIFTTRTCDAIISECGSFENIKEIQCFLCKS